MSPCTFFCLILLFIFLIFSEQRIQTVYGKLYVKAMDFHSFSMLVEMKLLKMWTPGLVFCRHCRIKSCQFFCLFTSTVWFWFANMFVVVNRSTQFAYWENVSLSWILYINTEGEFTFQTCSFFASLPQTGLEFYRKINRRVHPITFVFA